MVTACATGAHAIGDAARLIMFDDADVMLAAAPKRRISRLGIAGFNACKALSTAFNDTPEKASRPYDKDRDGFVMGEGAGCVMLEEYEHAKARGAKIYGEVKGYGLSGDAYHITAPSEDGDGGFRAMQMALKRAGLVASDIDYVNAHGTSTMADGIELAAVERLLGNAAAKRVDVVDQILDRPSVWARPARWRRSSACSRCATASSRPRSISTIRTSSRSSTSSPTRQRKREIKVAMSNSFGFGGTNAALILTAAS